MTKFKEAYRLASEFMENPVWKEHWRDPKRLFKEMGWDLIPYKKSENADLTNEAYSSYKDGRFFILYSVENYETRNNYNLHHEGGHVIAAHPIRHGNVLCKSSEDTEKKFLEEEATVIGRNIFFPAYIVNYIVRKSKGNVDVVKKYFAEEYVLSSSYVSARFDFLEEDLRNMVYPKCIEDEAKEEYEKFLEWNLF